MPAAIRAFTTERLTAEPLMEAHAAALYRPLLDVSIYRYMPHEPPESLAALATRYRKLESRKSPDGSQAWLNWVLRLKDDQSCAGTLEATIYPNRSADIAYTVFSRFRRRGLATEAVGALLVELKREFGVERARASIDTRNDASAGLVTKLGFTLIETIPNADFFKGATSDEFRFEKPL